MESPHLYSQLPRQSILIDSSNSTFPRTGLPPSNDTSWLQLRSGSESNICERYLYIENKRRRMGLLIERIHKE